MPELDQETMDKIANAIRDHDSKEGGVLPVIDGEDFTEEMLRTERGYDKFSEEEWQRVFGFLWRVKCFDCNTTSRLFGYRSDYEEQYGNKCKEAGHRVFTLRCRKSKG